jgi:oligosaccharide repeat unit polymerase
MTAIYLCGLLVYYFLILKKRAKNGAILAKILWLEYFFLGLSAALIDITNEIPAIFSPNYFSVLVLLAGIIISISGFLAFNKKFLFRMPENIKNQKLIENILIISQILSIAFFAQFAVMSFSGDTNENRILIGEKIELLSTYGLFNTLAGAVSQLFSASLVLAFMRLCKDNKSHHDVNRAYILIFSSLSYVVYILAYVGRDGVVYWLMTYAALYFIFRDFISVGTRKRIALLSFILLSMISAPFIFITVSRFSNQELGIGWSFLEYFGAQIQNFSDFSSIDRPVTLGMQNFPMFIGWGCNVFDINCIKWEDLRVSIFEIYLFQGKAPWVFGTFISDFVADFGEAGAIILILMLSFLSIFVCRKKAVNGHYSLSRFLFIMFLFSIPYWGVFYFRFSIINGYIVVNLLFILMVALVEGKQRLRPN